MEIMVRRLLYLATRIMLVVVLSSCTSSHLPSAKDYELIRSGKRIIVLLRITGEINGEPYEVFEHSLPDDNIGLALGSFETGGEPKQIVPVFLSAQTRKGGWTYLLLEPGLYYLAIQPTLRTSPFSYAEKFKSAQLWRLDIPLKSELVYVGTLHLPSIRQSLLFGTTISSFISDKIIVCDEENIARKVAAEFFPEFGIPKTILMQRHEGPIILKAPAEQTGK